MHNAPIGTWTVVVCLDRNFPIPLQEPHSAPRGTVVPVPWQLLHVLAIWKPLSRANVRVPVPLQGAQVVRCMPSFRPEPLHGSQSTIDVYDTCFLVPLQASRKLTFTVASMSLPRGTPPFPRPPVAKAPNKSSNRSEFLPAPPPKGNPPNPPPPKLCPPARNALGSNPGFWEAEPYWSYAALFCSSFKIYI